MIAVVFHAVLFAFFVKVSMDAEKTFILAALYAATSFGLVLLFSVTTASPLDRAFNHAVIQFVLSWIMFSSLKRNEESGAWWIIIIFGSAVIFFSWLIHWDVQVLSRILNLIRELKN